MNHINAEVLKSTCFSEVWEVRLAEKNYVVDLSDHRKNKSPVLAGLIGMSPERTDCHPRDTGVPGHLFHGRWSLPIWHGKLAGWTLCCFASWLKGNMISAHPDTHAPEASHICEDNGSNHTHKKKQAWSISPEIGARWAQDHELLQLTWGHHSSWESSAPLWDHNQHWASTTADTDQFPGGLEKTILTVGWLQSPPQGQVQPEETRVLNSKKYNQYFQDYIYYICSTNRIYI